MYSIDCNVRQWRPNSLADLPSCCFAEFFGRNVIMCVRGSWLLKQWWIETLSWSHADWMADPDKELQRLDSQPNMAALAQVWSIWECFNKGLILQFSLKFWWNLFHCILTRGNLRKSESINIWHSFAQECSFFHCAIFLSTCSQVLTFLGAAAAA